METVRGFYIYKSCLVQRHDSKAIIMIIVCPNQSHGLDVFGHQSNILCCPKLTRIEGLVKVAGLKVKGLQEDIKMTEPNVLESLSMNELKQRINEEQAVIECKRDENTKLDAEFEVYKEERDKLKQRISALQKTIKNAIVPCLSYDTFRLKRKTEKINEEAQEHNTIRQEIEDIIPTKIADRDKEVRRKERLLRELEKSKADWEMLELAATMSTKFEDGQDLMGHVQVLDQMKAKYKERLSEALEKAHQLREYLKTVESKHQMEASQMTMKMSELQEEKLTLQVREDEIYVEYNDVLDKKEKYFGPAQVETAIINIHDMVAPYTNKNDATDMYSMLDKIQEFFIDHYEILDQYAKHYGQA